MRAAEFEVDGYNIRRLTFTERGRRVNDWRIHDPAYPGWGGLGELISAWNVRNGQPAGGRLSDNLPTIRSEIARYRAERDGAQPEGGE